MSNKKDSGVYQLDNGYWAYRFKINIDGTTKEKRRRTDEFGNPFKTKTSAVKARQQAIVNEKVSAAAPQVKRPRKKVSEVYDEYCEFGRAGKTYATIVKQDSLWNNHIKSKFGKRYVDDISVAEINDYLAELYYTENRAYSYTESFLKIFYLIFGQAYSRNYLNAEQYDKLCKNKDTKIHMPKMKIDEDTVPYVAVGLTAMAHNLKDADIDFFFLHSHVSRNNIEMLEALCEELENCKIHFHEILVPHAEVYSELAEYGTGWTGEAYYSLCAHLLLPDEIDRVLYLDAGDTLIVGDIAPYYHYDFQGKSLVVTGSRYKPYNGNLELFSADDLGDWKDGLPGILRGIFNSGSYMMNLDKMRKDERTLADYQYLSLKLRELFGDDNHNIYWGDQGLLSATFVGDVRYYGFPEIRNLWYMPYNFCLWYYDRMNEKPNYSPAILHFAGTAFKPWNGTYPIFTERFQKKEQLHSMNELKNGQAGYFYLWHEYAIMANTILDKIEF